MIGLEHWKFTLVNPYSSRAQQGAPLVRRSQWEIEHDKHTISSRDGYYP
jgi:hypothetical protein